MAAKRHYSACNRQVPSGGKCRATGDGRHILLGPKEDPSVLNAHIDEHTLLHYSNARTYFQRANERFIKTGKKVDYDVMQATEKLMQDAALRVADAILCSFE